MVRHLLLGILALAACQSLPTPPAASGRRSDFTDPSPAVIGETFTLDSKILGERRVITVYLPPGYAKDPAARFPVLYMPDGGLGEDFPHVAGSVDVSIKTAVIRPVLVVGIENIDRKQDLTAGADRFRAFLRDELKPHIARRYRTTAESGIIGESLAGLFVLETFVLEPTLFDRYLASSPSVWWNERYLVTLAHEKLAWWSAGPKALYVATSDEVELEQEPVQILVDALRIHAPPGVTWVHDAMPDEHHGTIYPRAALRGIRLLFAP